MSIKIGLLGFGTVASGVPYLLEENGDKIEQALGDQLEIAKILVRHQEEKERLLAAGHNYQFVTAVEDLIEDEDIAIVVELMGRLEPARTYISQALAAGKHVVSANKDLIAVHGQELLTLADQHQVGFYYEAAVAGGIPILRTLANSLTADKVTRLLGVLNGTSNFMLTKMVDEGWSYEEALKTAQELGYAESDPTNDVEGIDAAYKATILSQFGFGMAVDFDTVTHQGISSIKPEDVAVAQQLGYVIKLVGDIREVSSGLSVEVSPTLVSLKHPLAGVNGVMNAVFVESIGVGQSLYYGPGAGQKPTATSVVADLINLGKAIQEGQVPARFNAYHRPVRLAKPEDITDAYYLSLEVADQLTPSQVLQELGIHARQILESGSEGSTSHLAVLTQVIGKDQLDQIKAAVANLEGCRLLNAFKVLEG